MQEFEAKRKALFDCLDDASSEIKGTSLEQTSVVNPFSGSHTNDTEMVYRHGGNKRSHNSVTERGLKHLRGKESLFKKPELPIARCLKPKRLPDFQVCIKIIHYIQCKLKSFVNPYYLVLYFVMIREFLCLCCLYVVIFIFYLIIFKTI